MRQKITYATAGFLVGLLIGTSVAQFIKQNAFSGKAPHGLELVTIIGVLAIFCIAGIVVGLQIDKYQRSQLHPTHGNQDADKFMAKAASFFSYITGKRIEGDFIIYPRNQLSTVIIAACLFPYFKFVTQYILSPYGNIFGWIVLTLLLIKEIIMLNDNSRAVSKKIITNPQGITEVWLEMAKK